MLTEKEVHDQSVRAFEHWKTIWDENTKANGELLKKIKTSQKHLLNLGFGKKLLCVACGASLETKIDIVKKYKTDALDIACVDKALPILIEHGLHPKYVFLADAGVSYEKYCEKYIDQTEDMVLISNVQANPKWSHNWKGKVIFYVNKDNIGSEAIYSPMSGCVEMIPASSNVGNSVIVFSTQIFGYDEYLMLGYDFSFGIDTHYYAFEDNDKRYWMKHAQLIDYSGNICYSSQNLIFSSKWLDDFNSTMVKAKGIKLYNCSGCGVSGVHPANLEKKIKNLKVRKLTDDEKLKILNSRIETISLTAQDGAQALQQALESHNVIGIKLDYVPNEVNTWLNSGI
jgi:hypothetical protein